MQMKSIKPETTATVVAFNAIAIPNASKERMETIARSGISFVFIDAKV
jgi:mannitol/fructose-specific phosphotransferase system IIA component